jgi:hypothetical protein
MPANANYSEILATTIESRSGELADNTTKNNVLFSRLNSKGNIKSFSGGHKVTEELDWQENPNFQWYSGAETLAMAQGDVLTAAEFAIKQCAIAVVMTGLEGLQNSGREQIIDLLEGRLANAERTMMNRMAQSVYGDGTSYGGREITGLGAAVVSDPTTGTYGGIDRSVSANSFWRNKTTGAIGVQTAATIQGAMTSLYVACSRGADKPDLIIFDNTLYTAFANSLQVLQRFTETRQAELGFESIKFMGADVVLDGGVGGYQASGVGHFLTTKYIRLRPHSRRNMVPLSPNKRWALNQDVEAQFIAWAGNLTTSISFVQGYFNGN